MSKDRPILFLRQVRHWRGRPIDARVARKLYRALFGGRQRDVGRAKAPVC
jgi:hypothetical protein